MNKLDENHLVIKKTSQGDEWELQEWEEEGKVHSIHMYHTWKCHNETHYV